MPKSSSLSLILKASFKSFDGVALAGELQFVGLYILDLDIH